MTMHKDWFGVDIKKRAVRIRSHPLGHILKEALSNSLDAGATAVSIVCTPADGKRRDGDGLRAFEFTCTDNGRGCDDPEILRRVGSTTSDLHAETRGRFGQGLIDLIAVSESAEIRTLGHRLVFDKEGCRIAAVRNRVSGLALTLTLRHDGEGFGELDDYFTRVILPDGVALIFNGSEIGQRVPERLISGIRLSTVVYDPAQDRVRRCQRPTTVEIHPQHDGSPMIHELGIPVDAAPWQLPYDINVLQKTPLDTDRNMLPDKYRKALVGQLVGPMSSAYQELMKEGKAVPAELQQDPDNSAALSDDAKGEMIRTMTGAERDRVVRRNPFDKNDPDESGELEHKGYKPVDTRTAPPGLKALLEDTPTVAKKHDEVCKVHLTNDPHFPAETERQRVCIAAYKVIAEALLGQTVCFDRIRGGAVAAWKNGTIFLNIEVRHLWNDPLGADSIGTILHESAHATVSGHAVAFAEEVQRLGGKLAGWVGHNQQRWDELRDRLCGDGQA
jgi:hypothetical protein